MENFTFHNPTKLFFGKGQLDVLSEEVKPYGNKILLVYGGGSIKRNGIYEQVIQQLKTLDAKIYELPGVEPNPRITTVRKGVEICKREGIEFLLAVGGGSTIDCTKAIALGAKTDADMWDVINQKAKANEALPFGTVLTHAATGSEMNSNFVITNWETKEKKNGGSIHTFPKFSILDPVHTFTVPKEQTVYGIVDMMSHVLEHYFHRAENTPVQDRFCESVLKTVIETAPKLLDDLNNYEYRETILYCGTLALSRILNMGYRGDWATHNIEHAVSAVHDIPHGGGLAILFPNWMRHILDEETAPRMKQLAINVFDIEEEGKSDEQVALEGIKALRAFWNSLGAPSRLADYNIDESTIEEMAEKTVTPIPKFGRFKRLYKEDSMAILRASL